MYNYTQYSVGCGTQQRLIRMLQDDGWVHVAAKGSHWRFTHPAKWGRVTVPHPNKDIPRGTVASIYRQVGWNT